MVHILYLLVVVLIFLSLLLMTVYAINKTPTPLLNNKTPMKFSLANLLNMMFFKSSVVFLLLKINLVSRISLILSLVDVFL